ncbi:uncharacterized protein BO97DRAFT_404575 [Aspergillus homomorphus CBS 101889]|uniref:Uncharacterized protein n=1 Tax=Aspergillus homomorphus (strain CBS 101889) TaxID=1450537 RepID=A0A395I295_ASPHC|nr:hypothetical protein BO97DRAFT_404575 [Aspergillus homomorphus CBS 101889]RAL13773.1 hypothetical protein BO97DRAFT_404575 [Aspergillus homomorphus CBS 101889]
MQRKGAEREMKICHTQQPRLIPPMKPLVYDEAPIPRPLPRAPSLPSWMIESKNRASMSLKRKSTAPIRISAPSDFRRVSTSLPDADGFSPLELSFNVPGRQLPDLPHFDEFPLETDRRSPIKRPSRVLPAENSRLPQARAQHRPTSSFQLPRKPVGSGSRRSSLAAHEYLNLGEKQTTSPSPFIPHFSSRGQSSVTTGPSTSLPSPIPVPHFNTDSRPQRRQHHNEATSAFHEPPRTPTRPNLQDRPLPSIPTEESPSSSRSTTSHPPSTPCENAGRPPTTPSEQPEQTPSRSGRVTQWLFQANSSHGANNNSPSKQHSPGTSWLKLSPTSEKGPFRIRSRTLSGSTLASSITGLTGGFKSPPTPSLSSNTTATTPLPPAVTAHATQTSMDRPEKEGTGPSLASPFTSRLTEDRIYPTIFESEQPQRHSRQQQQDYEDFHPQYYENYRHSAVGLAF